MTIAELEDRVPMGELYLLVDNRRMAKGWTSLGTTNNQGKISKQQRMKKDAAADRMIRKTKVCKDGGELVKEAVANYEKREAEKIKRDKAIAEGRLKDTSKKNKTKSKAGKAAKA